MLHPTHVGMINELLDFVSYGDGIFVLTKHKIITTIKCHMLLLYPIGVAESME